jgi:hypothetical protein
MKTPERSHRRGISPVCRRRGARGQRNAKIARAFRAALPLSSRGGWVSRARHGGTVDRVYQRGFGRV